MWARYGWRIELVLLSIFHPFLFFFGLAVTVEIDGLCPRVQPRSLFPITMNKDPSLDHLKCPGTHKRGKKRKKQTDRQTYKKIRHDWNHALNNKFHRREFFSSEDMYTQRYLNNSNDACVHVLPVYSYLEWFKGTDGASRCCRCAPTPSINIRGSWRRKGYSIPFDILHRHPIISREFIYRLPKDENLVC